MKYKYDFMSIERTNTVKEILKNYNISCKIENTVIELFDPFIWLDEEDYAKNYTSDRLVFDLIGLKKCQDGLVDYLYFEIPKLFKISQTWSCPTNFHNIMDKLIQDNIVKANFDFPNITVEPPYFWKIIGDKAFLQKRIAKTIAEFNNKY